MKLNKKRRKTTIRTLNIYQSTNQKRNSLAFQIWPSLNHCIYRHQRKQKVLCICVRCVCMCVCVWRNKKKVLWIVGHHQPMILHLWKCFQFLTDSVTEKTTESITCVEIAYEWNRFIWANTTLTKKQGGRVPS